ncbi:type II secretion system protein GspK [Aeromonas sp. A-5]|uniref:type II secretion system protein GspK n=1 Tax=Aeromonas ichthyocola TaxID=3367746 RepID=UPI0038F30DB3
MRPAQRQAGGEYQYHPRSAALLVALYLGKMGLDDAKRVLTERPRRGGKRRS